MRSLRSSSSPVSPLDAGDVVLAAGQSLRFPPTARVRSKHEFDAVFQRGKRTADPKMVLHWLPDEQPARLGLAVSRKVDTRAVARNRIKRILRDSFRHQRARLAGGAYVIVARVGLAELPAAAVRDVFQRLLQRAGALPQPGATGTMPAAKSPFPPTRSSRDGAPLNKPV